MAIRTRICDLLEIEHPILLAGMGGASTPELAAAVSNAGGLGVSARPLRAASTWNGFSAPARSPTSRSALIRSCRVRAPSGALDSSTTVRSRRTCCRN